MTPAQTRQLRRRIVRVGDRLTRSKEVLGLLREAEAQNFHGPLKKWIDDALASGADFLKEADTNGNGRLDPEELVEVAVRWADEQIQPASPFTEWLSDVGLDVAGELAVAIYNRNERRIERRVERDKALLKRLRAKLAAG
ncbi:hypothetical protein ACNOYE_20440 [Nannocystaceae bacterium ST9]